MPVTISTPYPIDFEMVTDRKSTRLNSSHSQISYAVFCLKKKKMTVGARVRVEQSSRALGRDGHETELLVDRDAVQARFIAENPRDRQNRHCCFFFNDTATAEIYTLSLHDALPISVVAGCVRERAVGRPLGEMRDGRCRRSEEQTSELQSQSNLVCRLLLEKKK